MRNYSVEEISGALGKSPETVRRLIRTNKIDAQKYNSTKEGFKVSERALRNFLKENPRYLTPAMATLISGPVFPFMMAGVITSLVTSALITKKRKVTAEQVRNNVEKQIVNKNKRITEIQHNINELEERRRKLAAALLKEQEEKNGLERALMEFDFDELAKNINENI